MTSLPLISFGIGISMSTGDIVREKATGDVRIVDQEERAQPIIGEEV